MHDDDEPDAEPRPGPALLADGTLERPTPEAPPRGEPGPQQSHEAASASALPVMSVAESLELQERAPRPPEQLYEEPAATAAGDPRRSRGVWLMVAALGAAALLVVGAVIASKHPPLNLPDPAAPLGVKAKENLELLLANAPAEALIIESEPNGASIHVGDREIGQTPWVGDAPGKGVELVLKAKGYRAARVTLAGTPNEHVRVKLTR